MRSFILVIVAAFVLALGGMVYFWTQTSTHGRRGAKQTVAESTAPLSLPKNDTGSPLRPGEAVWLKKYDQRTGELLSEFMADDYSPQRGGRIAVRNVTARFYMTASRTDKPADKSTDKSATDPRKVIQLHGVTGLFSGDTPSGKSNANADSNMQAPSRGELHSVTLEVLAPADEDHTKEYSTLTLTMDNASFDSERSVIFTEPFKDRSTGKVIAADQVPVTIRGDDYDFDGRGMNMAWDQRDGRLKSLDIAHGERLVIKHPSTVLDSTDETPKPRGEGTVAAKTPATKPQTPVEKAAADSALAIALDPATQPARGARRPRRPRGADTTSTVPRPKIEQSDDPPIYRAVFHDSVRIVQNGMTLANADKMSVDFLLKNESESANASSSSSPATTRPATQPASQSPGAITIATTQPATAPARRTPRGRAPAASTRPATGPTTAMATDPNDQPVEVYWSGPLHVAPFAQVDLADGESIVTLEGAPVIARQQNSEIRASRLVYHSADASLQGSALPGTVVSLVSSDAHGSSTIKTAALEYLSHSDPPMAILTGKSTADLPAQADGAKMKAAWNERCTLFFVNLPDGRTAIETATLSGDVKIDHPQIKLDSQRLELAFDTSAHAATQPAIQPAMTALAPPGTQPSTQPASQPSPLMQTNLKRLVATTAVHCVMTDAEKKEQTIDCDRLTVITSQSPDGKLVPRTITADGSVHAVDPDQDLRAGHLAVTLAPSTRPSTPSTRPSIAGAATQPATQPDTMAGLGGNVDLQSLIAHDSVHVIGKKDGTEAFADTMLIDKKDGKSNVRLIGQPFATVIDKTNTITGPVIEISPDTQLLTIDGGGAMHGSQQDAPGATTKPIDVAFTHSLRVDGRKNVVDAIGDVVAKTIDADGSTNIVRGDRAQLFLVDVPATQPTTQPISPLAASQPTSKPTAQEAMAKKTIRQAIFQDNAQVSSTTLNDDGTPLKRMNLFASMIQYDVIPVHELMQKKITIPVPGKMLVEDYRPAATQPAGQQENGAGARGATAFQWSKNFIYDDAEHKATMTGGVLIDHRDDVTKEDALRLSGDQVVAFLEPMPPATQPATPLVGQPLIAPPTQPATKPTAAEPRYQVRRVIATGHILIVMKTGELVADNVEYNPITHILTARGSDTADAVFTRSLAGPGGTQPVRAQEMQWNALTDLPKITKPAGQFRK